MVTKLNIAVPIKKVPTQDRSTNSSINEDLIYPGKAVDKARINPRKKRVLRFFPLIMIILYHKERTLKQLRINI
jgi:hypothetical protein